jgi:long-chain fatty acid transport protein
VKSIFLFVLFSFVSSLYAQAFHNINGFYGDRDAGMGGAFTAVSDDPSGMHYNPAGLAYIYHDTVSTSSVNYSYTNKVFQDVLGPSQVMGDSQNYTRLSRNFAPSFIGVVKSINKYRLGFSIMNPVTENFDQYNTGYHPTAMPGVTNFRIRYSETNSRFLFGPSLARSINEKWSLGISLLALQDRRRVSSDTYASTMSGSFNQDTTEYTRNSNGFQPVIGTQFMPSQKISFGFSLKHVFFIHGRERFIQSLSGSNTTNSSKLIFSDSSDMQYASNQGDSGPNSTALNMIGRPQLNGGIPETTEARFGTAFFPSQKLLIAADLIYTSGFSKKQDQTAIDPINNVVKLFGREIDRLHLEPTLNYAIGLEYYITEYLAIRLGHFSNNTNTKQIKRQEYAGRVLGNGLNGGENINIKVNDTQVLIQSPLLSTTGNRTEHANLLGYTLGLSYETSKTTISLTFSNQNGSGLATLGGSLPVRYVYNNNTVYLSTTVKY